MNFKSNRVKIIIALVFILLIVFLIAEKKQVGFSVTGVNAYKEVETSYTVPDGNIEYEGLSSQYVTKEEVLSSVIISGSMFRIPMQVSAIPEGYELGDLKYSVQLAREAGYRIQDTGEEAREYGIFDSSTGALVARAWVYSGECCENSEEPIIVGIESTNITDFSMGDFRRGQKISYEELRKLGAKEFVQLENYDRFYLMEASHNTKTVVELRYVESMDVFYPQGFRIEYGKNLGILFDDWYIWRNTDSFWEGKGEN